MEKLTTEKRAAVLRSLAEGVSIASTTRITGTCKEAILKLLVEAGEACSDYCDRTMVDLPCKTLQMDEVHSFVGFESRQPDQPQNQQVLPFRGISTNEWY